MEHITDRIITPTIISEEEFNKIRKEYLILENDILQSPGKADEKRLCKLLDKLPSEALYTDYQDYVNSRQSMRVYELT